MTDEAFTIVITSCGRFDLLRTTLASLFRTIDEAPARTILIEDSGDKGVVDAVGDLGKFIEVIVNERKLGQMASIDRAYAMVSTPLIFHCEDDWEFYGADYIAHSRKLLSAHRNVSMVGLRERGTLNPLLHDLPTRALDGIEYYLTDPSRHPEYFSYSFNPGLRRRGDYTRLGPFQSLGHEADVSYAFKKARYAMAYLENGVVRHIGDGRHVDDPQGPMRPRNPFQKMQRSASKRLKRLVRRMTA
ncbi:MAG: glycosyltransferase [Pseudomonadota bacterium]